jgi:hypothetical protein
MDTNWPFSGPLLTGGKFEPKTRTVTTRLQDPRKWEVESEDTILFSSLEGLGRGVLFRRKFILGGKLIFPCLQASMISPEKTHPPSSCCWDRV